ncbi:hypothetical protein ASE21_11280 [Flavobacterium sp. Root901]|uniref:hypothetical protein n=1 Tax=Flavobacterium sp. Root901 TaxID=1736605 RepID=UPI00070925A9|nr:hypothetical protein [Flavobacterium sp. Root901]KRD10289.1 hypothetical protein ASE21_11280 [Flavobacterium sp. Root901]
MITNTAPKNTTFIILFFFLLSFAGNAQIGIGTVTPNASSVLDITSTTQGMLTPRMTTAQRTAIAAPADGLFVYDTDLKAFYFYSTGTSAWVAVNSGVTPRINFKRIRSTDNLATVLAAELAAGGGSKYLLNSNTLYEINGTVTFNFPIDLNNAYVQGLDANDDIILRTSGNIFEGATGGSIRSVTLRAASGSVFNLNGAATQNLVFRDCIVANSSSVGTISGFGLVFISIIQFAGNTNGITYNNITQLLLSNLGWFSSNAGTYEKLTGTFTLVEKQGGFSQVDGTAIGFDVSTSGLTITGDAVLESVVFTGSNTTGYVKGYTTGTYPGYNFNNSWNVRAAGIPTETDANAAGDFAMDYAVGSGLGVSFTSGLNPSNIVKVGSGTPPTTYSNLFRFSTDAPNRLRYLGKKKRIFQISGSISFQVPAAGTYIIYIAKNGTTLSQYKIYGRGQATNDIVVLPLNASAELVNNDYIEVYAQRYTGSNSDIIVPNMTVTLK